MKELFDQLRKLLDEYQVKQDIPSGDPAEEIEVDIDEPIELDTPPAPQATPDSRDMLVSQIESRLTGMFEKQSELEAVCRMLTDEITVLKNTVKGLDKIVDGTLIKEGIASTAFDKLINSI